MGLKQQIKIVVAGTGEFSRQLCLVFMKRNLRIEFVIDETRTQAFLGLKVIKSYQVENKDIDICFVAVGCLEASSEVTDRLISAGISKYKIIEFNAETKTLQKDLFDCLSLMADKDLNSLVESIRNSLGEYLNIENYYFKNVISRKKPNISFRLFGSQSGFVSHLASLPQKVKKNYSVDTIYHPEVKSRIDGIRPAILSRVAMQKALADLVITTSLASCSRISDNKLTMPHLIYDSLLFDGASHGLKTAENHYLAVPSKPMMKQFKKICIRESLKNVTLIPVGYPKLDQAIKRYEKKSTNNKYTTLLYAPTEIGSRNSSDLFGALSSFYVSSWFEYVLQENPDIKIIWRPYPDDLLRLKKNIKLDASSALTKLTQLASIHHRFSIDTEVSNTETYQKVDALVTDISSMAYSFAFTTGNPVIFLTNPVLEGSSRWLETGYASDRNKVGVIVSNKYQLSSSIRKVVGEHSKYIDQVKKLRDFNIYNFMNSEEYLLDCIEVILNNHRMDDWWSC